MKRLTFVLIISVAPTLLMGQTEKKDIDDNFAPAPEKVPPVLELQGSYSWGKVKNQPALSLTNYDTGQCIHPRMFDFCSDVVKRISLEENKKNKIISISILGCADGIHNKGIKLSRTLKYPQCSVQINYDGDIDDIQLAKLRACQIEEILRKYLIDKGYITNVKISQQIHDEPDGGKIGGLYRRVDVIISYLTK